YTLIYFYCSPSPPHLHPFPTRRSSDLAAPWPISSGERAMASDVLPLRRIDHVRFFVGNARQSAYFYRNAFGFDVEAEGVAVEVRSEEHTSELQSRENLVCRLLLEKKKK